MERGKVATVAIADAKKLAAQLKLENKDIKFIETAKGSIYRYRSDGRTERFKKVEGKVYEPQDALVFIPDYDTFVKIAPKQLLEKYPLAENPVLYEEILLSYLHEKDKTVRIIDQQGKELKTNREIEQAKGQVFIAFCTKQPEFKADFHIPVSKTPRLNFETFDTSYQNGEHQYHIGNKVVKIVLKDGTTIS